MRTEAPDYRESKGTSGRLTFRYETPMCGKCRNCLDKPKFGGSGKGQAGMCATVAGAGRALGSWNRAPAAGAPPRDPNEPCTICFAVVAEADAVFGSDVCSHVFHRECIEGWARECAERPHNVATRRGVRVSCPNCKKGTRVVAGPVEERRRVADGDGATETRATRDDGGDACSACFGWRGDAAGRFGVGTHVEDADDATVRAS